MGNAGKRRGKDKPKDDIPPKQWNIGSRRSSELLSASASADCNQAETENTSITPRRGRSSKSASVDPILCNEVDTENSTVSVPRRRGRSSKSSPSASASVDLVDCNETDSKKAVSEPRTHLRRGRSLKSSLSSSASVDPVVLKMKPEASKKRKSKTGLDESPEEDSNLLPHFILSTKEFKAIPFGPRFQADIPELGGSPEDTELRITSYIADPDNAKWLGATIWPNKSRKEKKNSTEIGKGRPETCSCKSPGSPDSCIRLHVRQATRRLHADLGHIFYIWKFHEMGEKQVADSWSAKDQRAFDDILRKRSPPSSSSPSRGVEEEWTRRAHMHFLNKSRRDVVSYYFNVYVLRGMRQNAGSSSKVEFDTDDDDGGDGYDETEGSKGGRSRRYLRG